MTHIISDGPPRLPDVAGLHPYDAALMYAQHGVPVAPFDSTKGIGKSCWNLVNYKDLTTQPELLIKWRRQFGEFRALATSPGQFGCLVLDIDTPPAFPKRWRDHLDDPRVPFVATRPKESKRRGHYWFALPQHLASSLGNPAFPWGEVRCIGGGIVLPPYGDRHVVRTGVPPTLPDELGQEFASRARQAGAGQDMSVQQFCNQHQGNQRPHKLPALIRLHEVILSSGRNPHDAMREALRIGLGEARIGYIPAPEVLAALREQWPASRGSKEFDSLSRWAVQVALNTNIESLQAVSDRPTGTNPGNPKEAS